MPDQCYRHKIFGLISVRKNNRIKKVSISVLQDAKATVRLYVPQHMPLNQALDFLNENESLVEGTREKTFFEFHRADEEKFLAKSYKHKDLGRIKIKSDTRIKKLSIRVLSDAHATVSISVPPYVPKSEAFEFLEENIDRLKRIQKETLRRFNERNPKIAIGSIIQLVTKPIIVVSDSTIKEPKEEEKDSEINLRVPSSMDLKTDENQELIKDMILWNIELQAIDFLSTRIVKLSIKHDLSFRKLSIRNQKTRWGSCSKLNDISLNLHLIQLPIHLIDYVIVHELCHTVERNHSENFWDFLSEKLGTNAGALREELKQIVKKGQIPLMG